MVDATANLDEELQQLQGMLSRERLAIDEFDGKRTSFMTHLGAAKKLQPGPWIAHRDLIYALALANLSPGQRHALARAVVVEHNRDFGVGRLQLRAITSGLPLGGSSLWMQRRRGGMRCLYTWGLAAEGAEPRSCDWLCLRAEADWALAEPARSLTLHGLETLVQLGGKVALCVHGAVAAKQVARWLGDRLLVSAHPRFAPHLDAAVKTSEAPVLLWPHDALRASGLARHPVTTMVLISAPESVRQEARRFAGDGAGVEVVDAACPGRIDRAGLESFWRGCGRPKILLRGDPKWAREGSAWLESLGATVAAHSQSTQLSLL